MTTTEITKPELHKTEKTKAELLKVESRGLRGNLAADLVSDESRFGSVSETLLKFHGIYQQKDRDRRKPGEPSTGGKPFTLMVRGRIPGGRLTAAQWLNWDEIADKYSSGGLRLTTRQSLQLHGILKSNLKATIKEINDALVTTTGACGDVVRNVTQAVNPWGDPKLAQLDKLTDLISKHFEASSSAYFEIFLDGQAVAEEKADPIYGTAYLPRKFKIGITAAGNNSIDILAQDLGLAATYDRSGLIDGYFVFVGGGMGMSHSNPDTHPRLASNLGWVPAAKVLQTTEAVVTVQRDYGNREDRNFARLKYLLDKNGVPWFRDEVTKRAGVNFEDRPLPAWQTPNYLGWHSHRDGTLTLGFHLLSGRIVDTPNRPLKAALRHIIENYHLPIQMTPDQDLILFGIQPSDKNAIESYLDAHGISPLSPRQLFDRALTCVALPTCSKALAEGERIGQEVFSALQDVLDRLNLSERAPTVRITGCPNGCARPYTAELGLVGQLPGHYAVFLGGDSEGQRLATKIKDKVPLAEIGGLFYRLASIWAAQGERGERLGDFSVRYGLDRLGAAL
ncbi:MAG: NADPH-dependent assimilatory sulfite reductase hemoprotein subunit [Deltaproteobacteria bacterium]|nr:NADPH-dependent assimilatory sulfite reductase hemoprotein subunit [Deltaproteobacteria bacterium]